MVIQNIVSIFFANDLQPTISISYSFLNDNDNISKILGKMDHSLDKNIISKYQEKIFFFTFYVTENVTYRDPVIIESEPHLDINR